MATPRRIAIKTSRNIEQILQTINALHDEVATLKAEVSELKDALAAARPSGRRSTKK